MIKALLESENAVLDNVTVSSVIKELSEIQERGINLYEDIKYTAEAVPVFAINHKGEIKYVIECDNLFKLMKSQEQDPEEAMKDLQCIINKDNPEVQFNDIALLVKDEDIELLQELCKDKQKAGSRINNIVEYTDFLLKVQSLGVKLLVDRL